MNSFAELDSGLEMTGVDILGVQPGNFLRPVNLERGVMRDLLVVGYTAIDILKGADSSKMGTLTHSYGGSAANVAVIASKLGTSTGLMTCIGNDGESMDYYRYLLQAGVNLDYTRQHEGPSDRCKLWVNTSERAWVPGAGRNLKSLKLNPCQLHQYRWIHIAQAPLELAYRMAKMSREVSMSIGLGPSIKGTKKPEIYFDYPWRIIFLNRDEALYVEKQLGKRLPDLLKPSGVNVICVTRGRDSLVILQRECQYDIPVVPVVCIDSTGGGDAFCAGLLSFYLKGLPLIAATKMGLVVASFVVESYGCQTNIPTLEDIQSRFSKSRPMLPEVRREIYDNILYASE
jgi:sugar/nucleoside kinase (ribokinase family)